MPGLEKVIVYFEGEVAIRDTLQEALIAVFGESPNTREEDFGGTEPAAGAGGRAHRRAPRSNRPPSSSWRPTQLFAQADEALAAQDLAKYQDLTNQARAKTSEAEQILATEAPPSATQTQTSEPASA